MSDYTPTTAEVRLTFARLAPPRTNPLAEFDRWLAQHDAEVRKQVAEEVAEAIEGSLISSAQAEDERLLNDGLRLGAAIAREIGGAS